LQSDLDHFARLVEQAPAGALDPASSSYLFHSDSAAAQGSTTDRQNETMYNDPTETTTVTTDRDITGTTNQELASGATGVTNPSGSDPTI